MGIRVSLTFFNEFEGNLALPSTPKPIQDKDMAMAHVSCKTCLHLPEDVSSTGEDRCWMGATFQISHLVGSKLN